LQPTSQHLKISKTCTCLRRSRFRTLFLALLNESWCYLCSEQVRGERVVACQPDFLNSTWNSRLTTSDGIHYEVTLENGSFAPTEAAQLALRRTNQGLLELNLSPLEFPPPFLTDAVAKAMSLNANRVGTTFTPQPTGSGQRLTIIG
jgi:hypothetical protein